MNTSLLRLAHVNKAPVLRFDLEAVGTFAERVARASAGVGVAWPVLDENSLWRATIVSAGLLPICVVRDGRIAISVEGSGIPLGMLDTAVYDAVEIDLRTDDRIVMMSDGLTEPLGDPDDVGRCLEALDLLVPRGIRTSHELERQIRALFGGRPLVDDATLIVIDL